MIRRDFLQAEVEKLRQALSKILGLKEAQSNQEATDLISKTLLHDFDLNGDEVISFNPDQFKEFLSAKKYPTEKLDLLSQFLLQQVSPFQQNFETNTVLNHVLTIYRVLEQERHTQSFENLNRQQNIIQFLQQNKYG